MSGDWPVVRLDEVAEVRLGRQRSPANAKGDNMLLYLRAANVTAGGLELSDVKRMHFSAKEEATFRLCPGDVLVSEASGSVMEVGKSGVWQEQLAGPVAFQNHLLRVRCSDRVLPEYLHRVFQAARLNGVFAELSRGVGLNHLTSRGLAGLQIALPDVGTQQRAVSRVADQLHVVERAHRQLQALERRAHILLDSALHSLFTRLADGRREPLGALGRWGSGGTPSSKVSEFYGGDVPWLVSGDLRDQEIYDVPGRITELGLNKSSAKWVEPGSVLVAMYGATIGQLGIARTRLTTNQAVAACLPEDRLLPEYLFWFLRSERRALRAAGQGAAQSNIGQGVLKAWCIPLPDLGTQADLVSQAEESQAAATRLSIDLSRTRTLVTALTRSVFTHTLDGGVLMPGQQMGTTS